MRKLALFWLLLLATSEAGANVALPAFHGTESDLRSLPTQAGLPMVVRVGLRFFDLDSVDETEETFVATFDLRQRWVDLRLRYSPDDAPTGFLEWRGAEADARLEEIWTPGVVLGNVVGEPSRQSRGLRLYPDGRVELMQRTTAQFSSKFDIERFPFDSQKLQVELATPHESLERLALDFRQDDREFSGFSTKKDPNGWTPGFVDLRLEPFGGWYGARHSRVIVALWIQRNLGGHIAAIFIPLFASLFIPLMVLWMNKVEDGEFAVEAFELGNVVIGGLFAVIALNFTVNAEYGALGSGFNTVSALFGLNYLLLAMGMGVVVFLYRFNLVKRVCGKYVQAQLFEFLLWALPLLVAATAIALLLAAKA